MTTSAVRARHRTTWGGRSRIAPRALLLAALALSACSGSAEGGTAPPASTPAPPASAASEPGAASPSEAAASEVPSAAAAPSGETDQGIVFSQVTLFPGSLATAGVVMQNTTAQVKSFTIQVTWKKGDDIVATGTGAVNDFLPMSQRVESVLIDGDPKGADPPTAGVDTMIDESDTSADADAAMKITFGKPVISSGSLPTIKVEVTNGDTTVHSFTVGAGIFRSDKLIGTGTGAVNDLAGGKKKTVTMLISGAGKQGDKIDLFVSTLIT